LRVGGEYREVLGYKLYLNCHVSYTNEAYLKENKVIAKCPLFAATNMAPLREKCGYCDMT
jgi:hypothetical protein